MNRMRIFGCLVALWMVSAGCHDDVEAGLEVTGVPGVGPGTEAGGTSGEGGFDCACSAPGACDALASELDPCQEAVCDVKLCQCVALLAPNAAECSDGDPCTFGTFCVNGACVGGTAFTCQDDNPCTEDVCTGTDCAFPPASGPCDDGDPCTVGDACKLGECLGEVPDAGCPCQSDADCASIAPDPCVTPAVCVAGLCQGGGPRVCDDGDACTTDYCDPAIGCTREIEPPCIVDDGNPCTADGCDAETGCYHDPLDGVPCQDGLSCNGNEVCTSGACIGDPCPCLEDAACENPSNPCAEALCDPVSSTCVAVPVSGACEDGNPCTSGTTCSGFDCLGGTPICPADHCCEPHSEPGCPNDWTVQICTCHFDPFCCAVAWDVVCVSTAETLCGLECSDVPGDCCEASVISGCDEESCALCVCAENSACCTDGWSTECVETADTLCSDSCACADGVAGTSCCEVSEQPGCSDAGCQDCVCDLDPYCCEVQWDGICVNKAVDECAGPCNECVFCGNGSCDDDESCIDCPADCGGCVGFCCALHPYPGCFDGICQGCVCGYDGACCETVWDEDCVALVQDECAGACPDCSECGDGTCSFDESCALCPEDCGGCEGDCCYDNGSPGCEDTICQGCVCDHDLNCCTGSWGAECLEIGLAECAQECECEQVSDCCSPDPGPGCSLEACEECVCALDSFCCEASFDVVCIGIANGACEGSCPCGNAGSSEEDPCCMETPMLGCMNDVCEACVCPEDSFCCETAWDILCVLKATDECQGACGCIPDTDCCSGKPEPGCEEPGCESCVCSLEPACCDTFWGYECVLAVLTQCNPSCSCPFKGKAPEGHRCCVASLQPGCDQPACEGCVCGVDDLCCSALWDAPCVNLALGDCSESCSCP